MSIATCRRCQVLRSKVIRAGALVAFVLAEGVVAHPRPPSAVDGVRLVGAVDLQPDEDAYAHGKRLLAADNIAGALAAFRQALLEAPDSANAFDGVGVAYDRLGRPDLARQFYVAGLAIDPASPSLLNNFGYSLYLSGDLAAAIATLRTAAASDDVAAATAAQATLDRIAAEGRGSRPAATAARALDARIELTSDGEQRLTFAPAVSTDSITAALGDVADAVVVAAVWTGADDAAMTAGVRAEQRADDEAIRTAALRPQPAAAPVAPVAPVEVVIAPASPPIAIAIGDRPPHPRSARAAFALVPEQTAAVLVPRRRHDAATASVATVSSDGPRPRATLAFDSDDAELNAFATRMVALRRTAAAVPSGDRGRITAQFLA